MITFVHFSRLAIHNLLRGGQRVVVALLCITFGVMSLVAMTMLAKSIESAIQMPAAQLLGGDLSIGRKTEDTIRPEDIRQLNSLQQSGEISNYTLIAFSSSVMFHTPGSGDMHFIGSALGVEPEKYPLAGSLKLEGTGAPGALEEDSQLPAVLQKVGDVVITRDLARTYRLKAGDVIILANPRVGVPVEGVIRGVASDTPNHQGDKIYFSIETAGKLFNSRPGPASLSANTVIVNTEHAGALINKLENSGWSVDWSAGERATQTANMWTIGLRGAGMLGLLVGGIGIANTMQVLLRRRQREIAIWKTVGYRERHLRLIFSLEAGLLGLAGSLLGAGLGVLISTGLLELFQRTSTLLYQWTFSPLPPLMGVVVGTLTTVIFATWAIVITSQASPMALLRSEQIDTRARAENMGVGCQSIGLGLILGIPFTALASLIMGSVIAGIGMLVALVFGIAILGGFFSGLLWVATHLIPLRGFPLARMAFNSLRRRKTALVFAMIALFIGVISLSMGMMVKDISERKISSQPGVFQGYNLTILGPAGQENTIRQAVEAQHPEAVGVEYHTALTGYKIKGRAEEHAGNSTDAASDGSLADLEPVLVGRSDPEGYIISGAHWGSQPDGVYVYRYTNVRAGSQIEVTLLDGTQRVFSVVGTYDIDYQSIKLYPPTGLLTSTDAFMQTSKPDSIAYSMQVAPEKLESTATTLGAALPGATVINLVAYAGRFMQSYRNLYILPIVMALLAMLAGLLLVANAVSLAMLERRYEIGILKTVGYSRRQILTTFGVEYGLVGVLATCVGVFLSEGFLAVMAIANHMAAVILLLSPQSLALIFFCGIGLTLITVIGITWAPASISPAAVLNNMDAG